MNRYFWISCLFILVLGFFLRIYPTRDNNFYFTMDQASDAVHTREIFERGEQVLKGPVTGISGLYAGPGWYYFISIGYWLFNGHPFGGVFMVILLNMGLTGFLMWYFGKKVSPRVGIALGVALQTNWFFYDTSRWAFNPFPTIGLSIVLVLFLTKFLGGNKKAFTWALVPIVLSFNVEIAASVAMLIFYGFVGLWFFYKKKISLTRFTLSVFLLPAVGILGILIQFAGKFYETRIVLENYTLGNGVFSGFSFGQMLHVFSDLFSRGIVPQSFLISLLVFCIGAWAFLKQKQNIFVTRFATLTAVLFFVSFIFFSTNLGWRDWHTYFLPPLIFIAYCLMLLTLKNKIIGLGLFTIIILTHGLVFYERYTEYAKPSNDYSILLNRMKVVDWIYERRENEGFNVYTYQPQIFDFASQYLFWWYGPEKYGLEPCEYSISPGFLKWYVPGAIHYDKPGIGCDNFRFLIIEPYVDQADFAKWYETTIINTEFVEKTEMYGVTIEKLKLIRL